MKYKLFEDYQKGIISDDDLIDLIDFASGTYLCKPQRPTQKELTKVTTGLKITFSPI